MKTILQQEQINKLHEFGIDAVRLTDLLSILPKKITDRRNIYHLEIGVWDSDDGWAVYYRDRITGTGDLDSYQEARELCDAIYNMIVWLKTQNIKEL